MKIDSSMKNGGGQHAEAINSGFRACFLELVLKHAKTIQNRVQSVRDPGMCLIDQINIVMELWIYIMSSPSLNDS